MKFIVLFAILLTTGCSSSMLLTNREKEIYRAIQLEQCLGVSEGPKLNLQEHSRKIIGSNGEKREMIFYYLEATDLRPGDCYDLFLVSQNETITRMAELRVNENLELAEMGNGRLLKDTLVNYFGHMYGEIVSYVLVNKETRICSALVVAPNPIEAKWDDGGYASATSLGPDMKNFCLRCTGFNSNETIHYTSRCNGNVKEQDYPVESNGTLTIILVPGEGEVTDGICRITLKRSSGERTLKIPFGTYAKDERYWRNF